MHFVQDAAILVPTETRKQTGGSGPACLRGAHSSDILLWPLDEFRKWAEEAIQTIRELRKQYPNSGDLAWHAWAAEKIEAAHITPVALERLLKRRIAANEIKH